VVQGTDRTPGAGFTPTPTGTVRASDGTIESFTVDVTQGALTTCSAGGTPLPPVQFVAWSDGGTLSPLPKGSVWRYERVGRSRMGFTTVTKRSSRGRAPVHFSAVADFYGRCQFGSKIVTSPDPYWGDEPATVDGKIVGTGADEQVLWSAVLPGGIIFR
jgi:hypothetical protein